MRKLGIILIILCFIPMFSYNVLAEETTTTNEPSCVVKYEENECGELIVDIESGEVGEIVSFSVTPKMLYLVKSVKVNGLEVQENEGGYYSFELILGENIIEVEYEFNETQWNDLATIITENINKAKEGDWGDIFSMKNLSMIIFSSLSLLMSSGFLVTLLKNKKVEAVTTEKVGNMVEEKLNETLAVFLEETIKQLFGDMVDKVDESNEVAKTLCRCFVLSQENTPQSRLAIIQELSNLKNAEKELSEKIKQFINDEIMTKQKAIKERDEAIAQLKATNESINEEGKQEDGEERKQDLYGEI